MHPTDLLAPLARRWLRGAREELDLVPVPTDPARQVVAGRNPDRILLIGNGPVIGFGVRLQELALPGRLAHALAARTGRGAVVDVVAQRGLTVERTAELAMQSRLSTYDAIVVSVGATDAGGLIGPTRWLQGLMRLLDDLRAASTPSTTLIVLPIHPIQRAGGGFMRGFVEARAMQLDEVSADVCAGRDGVELLPSDPDAAAPSSAEDYAALAERLADVLAVRLDGLAACPTATTARGRRSGPQPEVLRQAAVDRTGLSGTDSNAALERLLLSAREMFDVSAAMVTLIDGDQVVFKAASGTSETGVARAVAPCNRTIRQDGALVVPDLTGEPIAEHGARFYAGHALESPDGYRIGTLCIVDDRTRGEGDLDEIALVELASRVEAELWREIEHGPRTAPIRSVQRTAPTREPVAG